MQLQLDGKQAFVSGSSKGIGLAVATALAREGARVVVNGRTEASVAQALDALVKAAPGAALRVDGGVVQSCF